MAVIAMTREMGSGGRVVAQRVAEQLGLTSMLHELVEHDVAERTQLSESTIHHLFEGGATLSERWQIGSKRLAKYTAEEILALAQKGNVLIRGWGACVLLRDVPHVARIRVCAPMEVRERNVMARQPIKDKKAARNEIERNDAVHKSALKEAFGADREDARLYDMVLNTERLSIETCAKLVCDLAESPDFHETDASRAILDDKVLEAHMRVKLGERFTVGMGVSGIQATANGGKVVLKGIAIHPTLAAEAGEIVGAIPGVKDVQNRIEIVRGPRGL
jgi:cytidylate kinase